MTNNKIYTISQLAAELDISPSTIRFYESKGLISPERSIGNQRVYTGKNRARLKLIIRGKKFGATLEEISEMIGLSNIDMNEIDQIDKSLFYIEDKLLEVDNKIEEIKLLKKELNILKKNLINKKLELK